MKKLIRKVMGFFNIEISKKYRGNVPFNVAPDFENNNNIQLEFIGPPGSGKTTIANSFFLSNRNHFGNMLTVAQFVIGMRKKYDITENLGSAYDKVFDTKMKEVVGRDVSSLKKCSIVASLKQILIDDYLMKSESLNKVIVSDEGIVHNIGDILIDIERSDPSLFKSFMKNRLIVYCKPDMGFITGNLQERARHGKTIDYHKGLSIQQISALTKQSFEKKEALLNLMDKYNLPFLVIDPAKDIQLNCKEIELFLTEYIKKLSIRPQLLAAE